MSNGILLPRHRKLLEAQGFKHPVKSCPFCGSAYALTRRSSAGVKVKK